MPGDGDEVPRLLRDRHIKAVRDKFHRPPTGMFLFSHFLVLHHSLSFKNQELTKPNQ